MLSLKKICACCFITTENSRPESPQKSDISLNNNDITRQLENLNSSEKSKKPSKSQTPALMLKLEILDSQSLDIGSVFIITQEGLQSISSREKDGCVYIGSDSASNDIVISDKEKGIGSKHFMIKYDPSYKNSFALRDLGEGMGTFIRIDLKLYLKCNNIISFGDSHMIILIDYTDSSRITLKFIDGPKKDQSYAFTINDSPISIGRMADCSIRFDDSSLSRYHCLINYESGWFILDGDGMKPSTNGTWLYCEEFVNISPGLVFKAAETLFKATPENQTTN